MKHYLSYFYILLAGSLWGVIGLFNRSLSSAGFSSFSIVLVRNIGSLIVLGLIFLIFDRSIFKIKPKHLPYFFGTGIISILLFTLCYFTCQQRCSLATAAILLYTAPTFVVILSAILWKDKVTKRKLAALVITFLGCTFVTGVWSGNFTATLVGILLGIGSGFFYALYSIFARYALKYYKPLTVTFYTFVFAGIGSLALIRPEELSAAFMQPKLFVVIAALIIVSTVLPYIFYTRGLSKIDSGKASILASIEPVVASIVGILAFGEPMTISVLLGLLCILVSVYILR